MKKILLFFITVSFISCSVSKTSTVKTMDVVGSGIIYKPVVADLIVKEEKVSAVISYSSTENTMDNAKNEVVRKALNNASGDVLVEPVFESITKNGITELTVKGWAGNYKNFRPVEEKDIKLLEIKPSLHKANVYESVVDVKKKKTGLWVTLGLLFVAGLMIPSLL